MTTLLAEDIIDGAVLVERIAVLPVESDSIARLTRWVSITMEDLASA